MCTRHISLVMIDHRIVHSLVNERKQIDQWMFMYDDIIECISSVRAIYCRLNDEKHVLVIFPIAMSCGYPAYMHRTNYHHTNTVRYR
jgi:hypothetical protein